MVLLYHAYGATSLYQQVIFSILTLHYHLQGNFEEFEIVVYTDKPKYFIKYTNTIPISIELLTKSLIQSYKGPLDFVHRVKICVIEDCFTKYKQDIFYLDSDTYFTQSPKKLFEYISPGNAIMNSNDYDLISADSLYEDLNWLRIRKVIRDYSYIIESQETKIPMETRMWNAGVVGISYQDRRLLRQVLNLSDQIYSNKKVFTAEQFAFSYILQNNVNLISSGEVIFHYWPDFVGKFWKRTYSFHFRRFFKNFKNFDLKTQALKAYQLTQIHDQLKLPKESLTYRVFSRLKRAAKILIKLN